MLVLLFGYSVSMLKNNKKLNFSKKQVTPFCSGEKAISNKYEHFSIKSKLLDKTLRRKRCEHLQPFL